MIIFLVSVILLFWNLGKNTLSNWDEAWLAAVAREGGRWIGERWWYEPPLVTWVLEGMMQIGQSEWWLRSFGAVAALALVIAVYKKSGTIAALVLLSTIEFLFRARQINVDIPLSLFIFLAISRKSGLWLGLAAMTKRLSFVLAVPALVWALRKQNWRRELGLFLLVAVPWHIYSYLKFGQEFIDKYLLGFTVGKLTSINPVAGTSPLFYVEALRHGMKLWWLALPLALIWGWRKYIDWFIFVVTYLVALSLSPIKASWYMLPIYPALAGLIGGFWGDVFKKRKALGLILAIGIFSFNLLKWQQEWLVPQTTLHQATLAKQVKVMTNLGETIYLDDDWLPVAVFYSQRYVVPLRFNRGDRYDEPLELPNGSLVMTNQETMANLKTRVGKLETIKQIDDLRLVRVN